MSDITHIVASLHVIGIVIIHGKVDGTLDMGRSVVLQYIS